MITIQRTEENEMKVMVFRPGDQSPIQLYCIRLDPDGIISGYEDVDGIIHDRVSVHATWDRSILFNETILIYNKPLNPSNPANGGELCPICEAYQCRVVHSPLLIRTL